MAKMLISYIALIISLSACNSSNINLIKLDGKAQGTTYQISYLSDDGINYKDAIDSILKKIDSSLSTYLPTSLISRINNNDSTVLADQYFLDVFNKSIEVAKKTEGLFDISIGPLVNAWGFGFSKKAKIDSSIIDSLMPFVGYKMLTLKGKKIIKEKPEIQLDFNAIAQGYSVDVLADYLESKGVKHYLVELGGELKSKGKKNTAYWKVGIDQPNEKNGTNRKLEAVINLYNKALATSGNYRKFYIENGIKYAHIIDPRTGFPAKQNLLSTTVIADDAITADAYATAFMVMGLERSKQFLQDNQKLNLEVYFIYDENAVWKTYLSPSLIKMIQELK